MLTCPVCRLALERAYAPDMAFLCGCGRLQSWTNGGPVEWTFRVHARKTLLRVDDRLFVRLVHPIHPDSGRSLYDDLDVSGEDAPRVCYDCLEEAWADWVLKC